MSLISPLTDVIIEKKREKRWLQMQKELHGTPKDRADQQIRVNDARFEAMERIEKSRETNTQKRASYNMVMDSFLRLQALDALTQGYWQEGVTINGAIQFTNTMQEMSQDIQKEYAGSATGGSVGGRQAADTLLRRLVKEFAKFTPEEKAFPVRGQAELAMSRVIYSTEQVFADPGMDTLMRALYRPTGPWETGFSELPGDVRLGQDDRERLVLKQLEQMGWTDGQGRVFLAAFVPALETRLANCSKVYGTSRLPYARLPATQKKFFERTEAELAKVTGEQAAAGRAERQRQAAFEKEALPGKEPLVPTTQPAKAPEAITLDGQALAIEDLPEAFGQTLNLATRGLAIPLAQVTNGMPPSPVLSFQNAIIKTQNAFLAETGDAGTRYKAALRKETLGTAMEIKIARTEIPMGASVEAGIDHYFEALGVTEELETKYQTDYRPRRMAGRAELYREGGLLEQMALDAGLTKDQATKLREGSMTPADREYMETGEIPGMDLSPQEMADFQQEVANTVDRYKEDTGMIPPTEPIPYPEPAPEPPMPEAREPAPGRPSVSPGAGPPIPLLELPEGQIREPPEPAYAVAEERQRQNALRRLTAALEDSSMRYTNLGLYKMAMGDPEALAVRRGPASAQVLWRPPRNWLDVSEEFTGMGMRIGAAQRKARTDQLRETGAKYAQRAAPQRSLMPGQQFRPQEEEEKTRRRTS